MTLVALVFVSSSLLAQDWKPLFNGANLDGWESHGPGIWTVMKDGTLLGQRRHDDPPNSFETWPIDKKQFAHWLNQQAWLYTKAEFGEYVLHLEYWIPPGMNSGVSIRDSSRGRYASNEAPAPPEMKADTPAHIGYEIQIIDAGKQKYPSGSVYLFDPAKLGAQRSNDWNAMEIESRKDLIRVRLNQQVVSESPGDTGRPKTGPIGLQLHDQFTFAMFRNIRIREIK